MLKEHNKEAYEATKNMLLEHRECCLVAATGIGKSNITTELIQELGLNTLVIAPKTSIRDEWTIMPDKYNIPPTFSTMTYQYFVKHYENLYGFDAYIFDEAHHTGAPKWGKAIRKFREGLDTEFVLGLTADPNRYSDKSKRDKENKIITSVVKSVFNDHAVYGHDQRSAIENGILPRATYVCSIYNADEMFDKYAAMDLTEELRGRLNYTRTNCEAIEDTLRRNVPNGVPVKGIVFVDSISNIDIGVRLARRAFPREAVHYIHSKLSAKENAETLKMFKKAKSGFIVSVDMIGEGLHIDGVNTIIMLRKTGSPSIYTQQIGRGLAAGSKDATIFDFVRNDTSIKKVLARIKNMKEYYETEDDDKTDSEGNTDGDNRRNHTRYPKISDQFIVKDKASDILEIFDAIDVYTKSKNDKQWTPEEDQILRDNYPSMGAKVCDLLFGRSKYSCYSRARVLGLSVDIKYTQWTPEEDQILRDNYPIVGVNVYEFLNNKSKGRCRARAKELGVDKAYSNKWTPEEDQILRDNYPIIGSECYKMFNCRTKNACANRAKQLRITYNYVSNKWTPEEDQIIRDNYPKMGIEVATLLPSRTKLACRQRAEKLNIYYNNPNWSEDEDQILRDNYPIIGSAVADMLPGRTEMSCQRRASELSIKSGKARHWSEDEDQILRDNYPNMGSEVYKLLPNRSSKSCITRAKMLSISTNIIKKSPWSKEEDQILRDNYPSMGPEVYKRLSNRSRHACLDRAKRLGLKYLG